jgi:hypothetical protein
LTSNNGGAHDHDARTSGLLRGVRLDQRAARGVASHGVAMIKAIARVVYNGRVGFMKAFVIESCPSDRKYEGTTWTAPSDTTSPIGSFTVVKFTPDDQFAYEVPL